MAQIYERAVFGGNPEELNNAISWINVRKDKLLEIEIDGIYTGRTLKKVKVKGLLIRAQQALLRNYLAIWVKKGQIGDFNLPFNYLITVGFSRKEDVRPNTIILKNTYQNLACF